MHLWWMEMETRRQKWEIEEQTKGGLVGDFFDLLKLQGDIDLPARISLVISFVLLSVRIFPNA